MEQPANNLTQLAEGWPAPPHWYKLFPGANLTEPLSDVIARDFKPPAIPPGNVTAFASIVDMSEGNETNNLAGLDDVMFDADSPMKEEFSRLFEMFLDEVTVLFGQSAQTGSKFSSGATGRCKNIVKIYQNLQNMLQLLRHNQFLIDLERRLQEQYYHKLKLINDIRQLAFDLPPIE